MNVPCKSSNSSKEIFFSIYNDLWLFDKSKENALGKVLFNDID